MVAIPTTFSFLYPSGSNEHEQGMMEDAAFVSDLSADWMFSVMRSPFRFRPNQAHPIRYYTDDPEVIRYRLDLIEELLADEALTGMLGKLLPELEDLKELATVDRGRSGDPSMDLYCISEIELYTGCMDRLYAFFRQQHSRPSSSALTTFRMMIKDVVESADYRQLKTEVGKMTQQVRHMKSVTIGVNLDAQLKPVEAGLLSINTTPFKSGNMIDKLLRMEFRDDGFTCLAPLEPIGKGMTPAQVAAARNTVNSVLGEVLQASVRSWRPIVRSFTNANYRFLIPLAEEIRFLLGAVTLLKKLLRAGLPVCKPTLASMEERRYEVEGLYHPVLALKQQGSEEEPAPHFVGSVVRNNIEFDENGRIYLLTGPNQGGKTIFTQAVGLSQLMLQLGLFVPGYKATISPVDGIYTHFPAHQDLRDNGRFGDECQRLMSVFGRLSRHSLLLMDETFSSTGAAEATCIAEQVLMGLQAAGCRVIFATHLHELTGKIDRLNEHAGSSRSRIDTLVAELDRAQASREVRSYVISRSRPQGLSYARDIAEKYGVTLDGMLKALNRE